MFTDNYTHGIIRKYVAYMGALFSNVHIDRTLADGSLAARFKIPLHFAKVEHALERIQEDPDGTRQDAIALPAMSYELVDMVYAGDRHQMTRVKTSVPLTDDPNSLGVMHAPAPWDFHFRVAVLVKNINDGLNVVEAVVPYFTPDFTAQLELIPEMGISHNIPVVLQSAAMELEVPPDYKTRVTNIFVMDFVLQGYLYGPEKRWPIIKFAEIDLFVDDGNGYDMTQRVAVEKTQPGLTAGGLPTTDINQSVPVLTIRVTDNYGYIEQK